MMPTIKLDNENQWRGGGDPEICVGYDDGLLELFVDDGYEDVTVYLTAQDAGLLRSALSAKHKPTDFK